MALISLILCLCLTLTPILSEASNVGDSLVISIQLTKTPLVRPLEANERDILSIYDLVYESVVTIDDNYLPQPYLCTDWEQSSNGKTWTFRLRDNITFSDGTPLTAHDVVATAQAILNRANDDSTVSKGFYANLKYFISSISATGDYTFVVCNNPWNNDVFKQEFINYYNNQHNHNRKQHCSIGF